MQRTLMATQIIKNSAINIGRILRSSRIEKGLSQSTLFSITGISMLKLHHLEFGNYEFFNNDFDDFLNLASCYAKALNVQLHFTFSEFGSHSLSKGVLDKNTVCTPVFIRKKIPLK
jgi:transcriptional regulator with XRE-family HTH domain